MCFTSWRNSGGRCVYEGSAASKGRADLIQQLAEGDLWGSVGEDDVGVYLGSILQGHSPGHAVLH